MRGTAHRKGRRSDALRLRSHRELLSRGRDWIELTTIHQGLFEVLRSALTDWNTATAEEKERAHGWAFSAALQAEQALYMWREGLINEASYRGFLNATVSIAATPGGRIWWQQARLLLGDDASALIDRELETRLADALDWMQMFPHWKQSSSHQGDEARA